MNFTHGNHLQYTVGGRLWGHRVTCEEPYRVQVGRVDPQHFASSDWYSEQLRTADLVWRDLGPDLVVMFSGGTDSEIVVRSFLKIGVRPRCVFIRFVGDYNAADLILAQRICTELNLELEVIDFDVVEYYRSGRAAELSSALQCRQIAYLSVYENIKSLQCPAVMGGEVLFRRHVDPSGSRWFYCFRENEDASAIRFSIQTGLPLVNEWFSYTPEMIAYYLQHPDIQALISTRFNYKLASVSSKNRILNKLFDGLVPKVKTHGYEKLLGFNGETYRALAATHPKRLASGVDGIFINDLVAQLGISRED